MVGRRRTDSPQGTDCRPRQAGLPALTTALLTTLTPLLFWVESQDVRKYRSPAHPLAEPRPLKVPGLTWTLCATSTILWPTSTSLRTLLHALANSISPPTHEYHDYVQTRRSLRLLSRLFLLFVQKVDLG